MAWFPSFSRVKTSTDSLRARRWRLAGGERLSRVSQKSFKDDLFVGGAEAQAPEGFVARESEARRLHVVRSTRFCATHVSGDVRAGLSGRAKGSDGPGKKKTVPY